MSNACACANTAERERGYLPDSICTWELLIGSATDQTRLWPGKIYGWLQPRASRGWAESILSLWYENQIALLYAKWIDDHQREEGRAGREVHLNWDWIGLPASVLVVVQQHLWNLRLYLWFVNCVLWWCCCLWNYYTFTGRVKSVNLPLHLVACKDINNARSASLSLTLCFKLGAPAGLLGILFLWARKCWALKFNCAATTTSQRQNKTNRRH